MTVKEADRARAINGAPIDLKLDAGHCRAHDEQGNLIALLIFDHKKNVWRADKVFAQET
jgi:hypothetical protein